MRWLNVAQRAETRRGRREGVQHPGEVCVCVRGLWGGGREGWGGGGFGPRKYSSLINPHLNPPWSPDTAGANGVGT